MTLRDLILKMPADENLVVRRLGETERLETTPEEIINEYEDLQHTTVEMIWTSHNVLRAIVIEVR